MMSQLGETDRHRLAKLLGMLGSEHAGEVLNAARFADRLVREAGATWSGVITPVVAGPTSAPQPEDISIDVIRRVWRRAVQWCLNQGGHMLRGKDRDFLRTIAGYRHRPSDAQLVWLQGLVSRIRASGGTS